jgi:ABC-type antimicrobial peptide transport system permease subunit
MEIVGIASNMQEDTLTVTPAPYLYLCIAPGDWPDPEYVVRTHGDPRSLLQAIRPIVHSVAPSRAVFGVKTLQEFLDATMDEPRMNTRMLTWFAGAALLLAAVGLYSLVSLSVTSRTREIGVRMTLGARPGRIVLQVLARVARLLSAGIGAGLMLLFLAERLLRSVLFGVSPLDAVTLAATVLVLAVVAGVATVIPARRAARIDPLQAMK